MGDVESHAVLLPSFATPDATPNKKWATASSVLTDKNVAKTGPILDPRVRNKKNGLQLKL
jgi:hypothetical protein